jgi:hypothetical protein
MGLKLNPRAPESMQISIPRAHHFNKKRKRAFSKVLKLCSTSKPDSVYKLRSLMDRNMNPREPEIKKISNPRGHHNYKKSEKCIFKDFKIVLHPFNADQNQKEIASLNTGLKLNPRASERMQISNPRAHHICKKSEECIFKDFKIVLHSFDADQNQKEITR